MASLRRYGFSSDKLTKSRTLKNVARVLFTLAMKVKLTTGTVSSCEEKNRKSGKQTESGKTWSRKDRSACNYNLWETTCRKFIMVSCWENGQQDTKPRRDDVGENLQRLTHGSVKSTLDLSEKCNVVYSIANRERASRTNSSYRHGWFIWSAGLMHLQRNGTL